MIRTNPKLFIRSDFPIYLTSKTALSGFSDFEVKSVNEFCTGKETQDFVESVDFSGSISDALVKRIESELKHSICLREGAFVILRKGKSIGIYANDKEGRQNGIMTFLRSLETDRSFADELIFDSPFMPLRGVKVLMPARGDIEEFKRFVDSMAFFKHNTLMLEIGGAMEYKKHPEINEGWEEYSAFMSEYSGKTIDLQERTFPWRKNSIHCNNGGGSYLTQNEIKDIISYCKERNVKIIPEVPSTSHCDYLLTRHPELAERCEDPYPDTFCPSNPASYEILFDVIDEIIELFSPEIINIGHDEYYSINVCDRCRKRLLSNEDILAEDINKIHDHLASRGVKTMLWCDKLMNVERDQGYGGALSYVYFEWDPSKELLGIIRPTWGARNKIPKDIICLNWYHSFGEEYDTEIKDFPSVYGNFSGQFIFKNFKRRVGQNVFGGICSNWGGTTDVYFRRNNVLSAMVYNEIYYWDESYDDTDPKQYKERVDLMFRALFEYRNRHVYTGNNSYIEAVHRTDMDVPYRHFVDGVFPEGEKFRGEFLAGRYAIHYENGITEYKDIFYGEQAICESSAWYYGEQTASVATTDSPGTKKVRLTLTLSSLAGEVMPEYKDGRISCRIFIKNPHPELKIEKIELETPKGASHRIACESVRIN